MIEEIKSAVTFLTRLIAKSNESSLLITEESIELFSRKLCQLLEEKFKNHWFPDRPIKGQAFRCIRFNENNRSDPIVEKACKESGINYIDLKLPLELTLWVDPNEVTCRFGEHKGSYCMVAKFSDGRQENYIDSINIEELEQKSVERYNQASYDLVNSRKKRQSRKNAYNSNIYNMNGFSDYSMVQSSPSSSPFYSIYSAGTPFGTPYGSSPPNGQNGFIKQFPISPPQSRVVGNGVYRGINTITNYKNQAINNKANNNNYSRQLFPIGGTGFQTLSYNNDRYHWNASKNMAKA